MKTVVKTAPLLASIPKTDLLRFQHGIKGLLRKIEIDPCDSELKENIKAVYELLSLFEHQQHSLAKGISPLSLTGNLKEQTTY